MDIISLNGEKILEAARKEAERIEKLVHETLLQELYTTYGVDAEKLPTVTVVASFVAYRLKERIEAANRHVGIEVRFVNMGPEEV